MKKMTGIINLSRSNNKLLRKEQMSTVLTGIQIFIVTVKINNLKTNNES